MNEVLTRAVVVDDSPDVATMMREVLVDMGWQCSVAHSVKEGRQQLDRWPGLELVVIDIVLPDGTGLQLAQRAKAQHPQADIVVVTGYPSFETAIEAMRCGVIDYVSKPFDEADFRAMVERATTRLAIKRGRPNDSHGRRVVELIEDIQSRLARVEAAVSTLLGNHIGRTDENPATGHA